MRSLVRSSGKSENRGHGEIIERNSGHPNRHSGLEPESSVAI